MATLQALIADAEVLLAMAPEELAPFLLRAAVCTSQNDMFTLDTIPSQAKGTKVEIRQDGGYPQHKWAEIDLALSEAWNWLQVNCLILPASGINGRNGWMVLSRRGRELVNDELKFTRFRQAAAFPKEIIHKSIADKVWLALARGDLDDAVFFAFRAVEEAVREATGFGPTDVGVDMMRKAFATENGPLTNASQPKAEREALGHLFAGAIGSYKNPHSHRTVSITEPGDAQEMVLLASHLLRIVEARRLNR